MLTPMLLKKKAAAGSTAALSIVFTSAAVGDKTMIDRSANARIFTRKTIAGNPGTDGVVNDPTFGMCYKFDGYEYFDASSLLQFSQGNYRLEIDFVPKVTTYAVPFRSGDFTANGNKPGLCTILNQTAGDYFQCFLANGTTFQRIYLAGETNPGGTVLEQMVLTKQGGSFTVKNNRNGLSTTATLTLAIPSDSYLSLGVADGLSTSTSFIGLLKRLELFLLP